MVFSSHGNSSSYLPLDSDQSVTFYKNENSLFSPSPTPLPPTLLACRRNQGNNRGMSPNELPPFGNNSHGTVVVDAVCHDFQPVAHLSSNGYYGYVPASSMLTPQPPKMMSTTAAVNMGTVNGVGFQLDDQTDAAAAEDSAMDCGMASEMENFQQLQRQHLRKRKEYSEEATEGGNCKRRKTWLEEHQQQQHHQQAAGFPQTFGWNQLPAAQQQQMDCHDDAPMFNGSFPQPACNGSSMISANSSFQVPVTAIPVATVQPTAMSVQQPPTNHLLVDAASPRKGHYGSGRCDPRRWNIAMPTSRPFGTGCSAVSGHLLLLGSSGTAEASEQLSEKHHQQSAIVGGGGIGGQELEDLFVSLHGSGFFLAG